MTDWRKFKEGDRVMRTNRPVGRVSPGDVGTVMGYAKSGLVRVIYDALTPNEATQQEVNLTLIRSGEPLVVRVADAALRRDGLSYRDALLLEDRLNAERSVVKPPRPAARWTFRREWRKAAPTVHGAFMGLTRILSGPL